MANKLAALSTKLERIPGWIHWVAVLSLGLLLVFPRIGSFGLWEPAEVRLADIARDVAEQGSFRDITVAGQHHARPVLPIWLVATGFKLFGVNERAGRLPLALCGLLGIVLAFYFGRRLISAPGGLAAAFVLATTPTYLMQSRQLVGDVVFYMALLAAIGGFAAYVWPADGRQRRLDLTIGAVGLVAGSLAQGLVIGTVLPLAVLVLGVLVSLSTRSEDPGRATLGSKVRASLLPIAIALLLSGAAIAGLFSWLEHGPYLWFGTTPQMSTQSASFEQPLKVLGFGLFPWSALLPVALLSLSSSTHRNHERLAFANTLVVIALVLGYGLATFWPTFVGPLRFPTLPWLAFGIGLWAWSWISGGSRGGALWPLAVVGLLLALEQDFFSGPGDLAFSHLLETTKYPVQLDITGYVRAFGGGLAVTWGLPLLLGAIVDRPDTAAQSDGRTGESSHRAAGLWGYWEALAAKVSRYWEALTANVSHTVGLALPWLWTLPMTLTLAFALWVTLYLTPQLSYHMSNKALFQTYLACSNPGERLAQYQVSGGAAAYYTDGKLDELRSQTELFKKLRDPKRQFALIPTSQLGAIDQAARRQKVSYYVLDDRNSKYLIISNKLEGQCSKDHNPLRRLVVSKRPTPQHQVTANFEDRVKLIGYDCPTTVHSGGKFKITLYFEVLGSMPPNYKVFIHFDKPASRFHGDHVPLGGKYPTQYWLKGDFIIDPHEVELPLLTTSTGTYSIHAGFWLGSKRLKVKEGPNDGHDRVSLGTIRVRAL